MTAAPSLLSSLSCSLSCFACNGNGCACCGGLGETRYTSEVPDWQSETPAGVCECGGLLFDTWRTYRDSEARSGGVVRYQECDSCEWREAK